MDKKLKEEITSFFLLLENDINKVSSEDIKIIFNKWEKYLKGGEE